MIMKWIRISVLKCRISLLDIMYHVVTNQSPCTISTDRGNTPRLLQVQDQDGVSQRPQPHLGGDLRDRGPPARARLRPVHGEFF